MNVKPFRAAVVKKNNDFFCTNTYSGYSGPTNWDPKGVQNLLPLDVSDDVLGAAVISSMDATRFVLPAPRKDVWIHPDVEFDMDLFDYKKGEEFYDSWVADMMRRYGYKTKRALFKGMNSCSVKSADGVIAIRPSHHEKLEAWSAAGINEEDHVKLPATASPEEIGAALRLAFSRCTG